MSLQSRVLTSLESMAQVQKVDLGIVKVLDDFKREMANCASSWLEEKHVAAEDVFLVYHSIRNMSIITDKAKSRFIYAADRNENPLVVNDALSVFPYLIELYDMVCSLRDRIVSSEVRSAIWKRLRLLRDIARKASLLPSTSEELKGLDVTEIRKELRNFASAVQAVVSESQGPP